MAKACEDFGWNPDIASTDLASAIEASGAELAVVVTPPKFHRQPVIQCLEAGLHVISEKPMAESIEDCKAMLEAAEKTGMSYTVSQNYRYQPPFFTIGRLIREGLIGEVGQVKFDFYMGVNFGEDDFRHKMDYPLLIDMSIHHFDLIRFVTDQDAVSVKGSSWNPSWSNYAGDCSSTALFTMDKGARVLYNASWCAKGQFTDWSGTWQIEGEKGTLIYDHGKVTHIPVEGLYKGGEPVEIEPDKMEIEGQKFVLADVLDSISEGKDSKTDCKDNIKSVGMVFSAVEATRTGKEVTL